MQLLSSILMNSDQITIGIVDDDPVLRTALAHLLSASGYQVEVFASAEAFLNAAPTTKTQCLLSDIELGDISGLELGRQLVANGFDFPIVFMTGSEDQSIRRQAIEFGCIAYLLKPFVSDQLFEAIRLAVGGDATRH
jgi:FixJ family two-component response regulator